MSIEVANLLARIQMVADGVPEVLRQTESVRKNLEQMGETGAAAANKISENQIKAATALGRYENAVIKAAEAQAKLSSAEAQAGVNAEQAATKVAELTAELDKLKAASTGGTIAAADIGRMKSIESEINGFRNVTKAAEEVRNTQHRLISSGERLVVANRRLGEETVQTGKRFRILTTEITGILSAVRQGEVGSTLLARALIRVVDASKAAGSSLPKAFAIGGAITLAVAAFGFVVKAISEIGQAVSQSHLPELSDDLKQAAADANLAESALKGVALSTANIFRSQDIANAEEFTGAIAALANQLRFLTPEADLAKTIESITRAVSSGNLESVAREFGISSSLLKEALGDTEGLSAGQIAERAFNALNQTIRDTPELLERVNDAMLKQESGWRELGAIAANFWDSVGRGAANVLGPLAHVAEAFATIGSSMEPDRALRMREAESNLNKALKQGDNIVMALGDSLLHLDRAGGLTAVRMQRLQAISGLAAEDLELVNASLVAMGIALPDDALADFTAELERVPTAAEMAEDAIRKFYDQVNNSNSIVDSIKSLAVAWHDMEADLTPASAASAFQSLGKTIEMVVTDGIGSLELLRLQAEAAGKIGFATPEQVQAAMTAYDAIEGALTPIAEEAARVRDRLTQDVAGGFGTTQSAASSATDVINTYIGALNSIPKTVSTNIIQNFSSTGGIVSFGGTGLPPTQAGITSNSTAAREASTPSTIQNITPPGSGGKDIREVRSAAAEAASAKSLADNLANVFDTFGLGKSGGGGGGGGGGNKAADDAASLEQIRALISAVNQAVAIGINGGVRIGTSGNVVPFSPGTFLNASGNQIAVEQIVIRGVWDFADPATRRQIVKELESALRELKSEL